MNKVVIFKANIVILVDFFAILYYWGKVVP